MDAYAVGAKLKNYNPDIAPPSQSNLKTATTDVIEKYKKDPQNWTDGKPDRAKIVKALTDDHYTGF